MNKPNKSAVILYTFSFLIFFGTGANAQTNLDPIGIFHSTASGVVACFEVMGNRTPKSFDETGHCPELKTPIWNLSETNPTVESHVQWLDTRSVQSNDKGAGNYFGFAVFEYQSKICRLNLRLTYSGEDISVELRKEVNCLDANLLEERAFNLAIFFAKEGGLWVEKRCLSKLKSNLNHIQFTVPFGRYDWARNVCPDPHFSVTITFDLDGDLVSGIVTDA